MYDEADKQLNEATGKLEKCYHFDRMDSDLQPPDVSVTISLVYLACTQCQICLGISSLHNADHAPQIIPTSRQEEKYIDAKKCVAEVETLKTELDNSDIEERAKQTQEKYPQMLDPTSASYFDIKGFQDRKADFEKKFDEYDVWVFEWEEKIWTAFVEHHKCVLAFIMRAWSCCRVSFILFGAPRRKAPKAPVRPII